MLQQLPKNLNYNDLKPIGFPSHVRYEKFTPTAFNQSTNGVTSADVIRFNISTNGFWDPYSAYIKIEVDISGSDGNKDLNGIACGSLQIDNSAQSFINQMIITKGGVEIERIEEYDTISAILNDCNAQGDNRQNRIFEGLSSNPNIQSQNQLPQINIQTISGSDQNTYGFYDPKLVMTPPFSTTTTYLSRFLGQGPSIINRYESNLLEQEGRLTVTKTGDSGFLYNGATTMNESTAYWGYQIPLSQSLGCGGMEPLFSTKIKQNSIYKGKLNQQIYADKCTFCIPLVSGLLGILMPKESYKYIPMKALQELILEFRLNPYAMFTSGYNDGSSNKQANNNNGLIPMGSGTNTMLNRIWRITKFEINVEMQYFEPQIENIILSQLNTEKGIVIHTQSWMFGPRTQIGANTSPNGTYQINMGFESLKNVLFCFMPDDFQTYTFCRKHYRLSANVTSMYMKIGTEYYPPLPITGHGGTPQGYQSATNDSDANNSEFVIQLYKTFGKFNDVQQNISINPVNFAINERAYNPTNVNPLCGPTGDQLNQDTAVSQSLFHENRCIGRAVYGMNLETLNQDYSVISGLNTINNRPFEINLKSDNTNSFTRSYNMYVFCNFDMLVQLRNTGIQILGKG